jgi:hypothetical protein
MSFIEVFDPGMRHWREEQDRRRDNVKIIPAPGPGPQPVKVDLEKMTVTIEEQPAAQDQDAANDTVQLAQMDW